MKTVMNMKSDMMPKRDDCMDMLGEFHTPEHVILHCNAVAEVSVAIGNKLIERDIELDIDLIEAAARLHDIARAYDEHEKIGGDFINKKGYDKVAQIVYQHTKFDDFYNLDDITELHILCISDRMVIEDRYVGVRKRMEYIKEKARLMGKESFIPYIEQSEKRLIRYIENIEAIMGISIDELVLKKDMYE